MGPDGLEEQINAIVMNPEGDVLVLRYGDKSDFLLPGGILKKHWLRAEYLSIRLRKQFPKAEIGPIIEGENNSFDFICPRRSGLVHVYAYFADVSKNLSLAKPGNVEWVKNYQWRRLSDAAREAIAHTHFEGYHEPFEKFLNSRCCIPEEEPAGGQTYGHAGGTIIKFGERLR